jgi:hypothetical protein
MPPMVQIRASGALRTVGRDSVDALHNGPPRSLVVWVVCRAASCASFAPQRNLRSRYITFAITADKMQTGEFEAVASSLGTATLSENISIVIY